MFTTHLARFRIRHASPSRSTGLRLIGLLLTVLVLTSASIAPALADTRSSDTGNPIELVLPNGNQLRFIPLHGEGGRLLGYGVAEIMLPETASYLGIRELRTANPAEVFHAFAPRGVAMPREMQAVYDRPALATQGWALDHEIFTAHYVMFPCHAPAFDDDFPSWVYSPTLSFNDGAASKPYLWQYDSNQADGAWDNHFTVRHAANVPSYHAKVTRCKQADVSYYYGVPEVRLEAEQGSIPFSVYLGTLPMIGSTVNFSWQLPDYPNLIMNWDLVVYGTYPGDEFHIGHGAGPFSIYP